MNLTPQQRKAIWICLALVVASYVIRSVMNFAQQQEYMRQQFIRAEQQRAKAQADAKAKAKAKAEKDAADRAAKAAAAKAAAVAKSAPALPKPEKPVSYSGIWHGQTTVEGRGLCTLRIELHETEPSKFQGYSTLVCADFAPLMNPLAGRPKERVNRAAAIKNRMNPEASVISGALENGAIAFHVDKTIGADGNGCAATSFTLTPFGKNEFAAEWQEATCKGGRVMLQKARK